MKNMCENKLSKEAVSRLKRAFAVFDVDGDGTICTQVCLASHTM